MDTEAGRLLWKEHRAKIQIGFVGLAIVAAVAIPYFQAKFCSVTKHFDEPATYNVTVDRPYHHNDNTGGKIPSITQFSFGPGINGGIGEIDHTEASYYAAKEEDDWGRKYVCDVTASDYFLVLFTLILAVATVRLWNSTKGLYEETKRLAAGAVQQSLDMAASINEQRRTAEANIVAAQAMEKTAEAADRHARAAIGAEAPILHIVNCASDQARVDGNREAWLRNLTINLEVKNFGRTTAVVTDVILNIGLGYVPTEPPPLTKISKYPVATAIEPGKSHTFRDFYANTVLTDPQVIAWTLEERGGAFVHGTIQFRDFMGVHEQGFVFIWIAGSEFSSFDQRTAYWKQA